MQLFNVINLADKEHPAMLFVEKLMFSLPRWNAGFKHTEQQTRLNLLRLSDDICLLHFVFKQH